MIRNERPTVERIHRTCREFQRQWSVSERRHREELARQRQRQLLELLRGQIA
jgi:hypothetical protein